MSEESEVSSFHDPGLVAVADPYEVKLNFDSRSESGIPQACYAQAHNRIPLLRSMKIASVTTAPSQKLTIRFSGEWSVSDRSPIKEAELVIDAPRSGQPVEVSPVHDLQLSDIALAELEEQVPATLIVQIEDDLGNGQTVKQDIDIFARDQWLGHPDFTAITASFVQPNHPDVTQVMARASEILEAMGRPGLSGYQAVEDNQHHAIAQAVFMALQEFVTTYINPPASFDKTGQKVRPIDRVLSEKQGTCIDLACAYASCLEQAGLHPVLFRVSGHAFAGYFNHEIEFNQPLITEWPAIQSYLDSKLIVPVETVGIPQRMTFSEAISSTHGNLNEMKMVGVVDVFKAHREGIRPLPSRVVRDNVLTVVIDNGPSMPPITEKRDAVTRKLLPATVPARVQSWKNSLLDLSFRNRLLNLVIARHGIGMVTPLGGLGWIEDYLNGGGRLDLRANDNLDAVQAAIAPRASQHTNEALGDFLTKAGLLFAFTESGRFKNVVSRMQNDARTQEEESGANCLYLTLGSVKWASKYGEYESPIFLVPIRMKSVRGVDAVQIEMDSTQTTSVNYCLIEALRLREQLTLQWFSDDMTDDLGLDVEGGLEALRKEFRERGLDTQGFSVDQKAGIAVLDFKKFRLWRDLTDHWETFVKNSLVKHLVETPRETFVDPAAAREGGLKFDDTSTVCVQSADGSQIEAIERALAGETFVLQGPPGSGKSQTITNLLANAMLRGKKVLFVAEKQAALQEVQERLEAVNLGPYCLVLHDSGSNPEDLRIQLRDALDQQPLIDEKGHQQFEDEFAVMVAQLEEYRRNVFGENEVGFSFASAFRRLGELGEGPIVDVPRNFLELDASVAEDLMRKTYEIEELTRIAQVRSGHPWLFTGAVGFESIDRSALEDVLGKLLENSEKISSVSSPEFKATVTQCTSSSDLSAVAAALELRERGLTPTPRDLNEASQKSWLEEIDKTGGDWKKLLSELPAGLAGKESILHRDDLSKSAMEVSEAAGSFALGRKGRISKALGPFSGLLDVNSMNPADIASTAKKVAEISERVRSNWATLASQSAVKSICSDAPSTLSEVDELIRSCSRLHLLSSRLTDPAAVYDPLRSLWASSGVLPVGLGSRVAGFVDDLTVLGEMLGATDETLATWSDSVGLVEAVNTRSRAGWSAELESKTYLSLQRWLALKTHMSHFRSVGLDCMCTKVELGELDPTEVSTALERGILTTTLRVRAEQTNLDVFDGPQQTRRVNRFIAMLEHRQKNSEAVIPYHLFRSRKINGGVKTGKVGDFRKEVNAPGKRRRGRSIRSLIEKYPEIVSDLTPCFLMSPDSVAQFLPPGSIEFDVVVFDEASQIVTADAIGSMGRAKSCVIVGDSKQMPPTRFGAVGIAAEEEVESEFVDFDEDSILEEAVAAGVSETLLSWHYRSQDESLIAFSNEHYYDRRLATFPAPVDFQPDCGVFYRRVNGQFDHGKSRTNDIEARAILDELIERLDDPATSSLTYGIVTLNLQQKNLITSLVESSTHPLVRELRDTDDKKRRLFVLNLESVQGRERDVIILGTSFSKRADGGSMPLNFGPLTQRGGEKRLNVAVTRAKKQFVVVTSFDPEDMGEAKSIGMVHLKDYMFAARSRSQRQATQSGAEDTGSWQVKKIAELLREKGVVVSTNRGLSDFKIDLALTLPSHPDEWLVAVIFDGEAWSRRPLAIDRDALPAIVLEKVMRWQRVTRVWMPSIRIDLQGVVDDLSEQVVLAARDRDQRPAADAVVAPALRPESEEAPFQDLSIPAPPSGSSAPSDSLPGESIFERHVIAGVPQDQSLLTTSLARKVLESLVDAEGPIDAELALKRVAQAFGLQRVKEARLRELQALVGTRPETEAMGRVYLWPAGADPASWRGFRKSDLTQRSIDQISPYELVNAMTEVIRRSISIDKPELMKWTSTYFGAEKMGAKIQESLRSTIEWAVSIGRFVDENDHLTLP